MHIVIEFISPFEEKKITFTVEPKRTLQYDRDNIRGSGAIGHSSCTCTGVSGYLGPTLTAPAQNGGSADRQLCQVRKGCYNKSRNRKKMVFAHMRGVFMEHCKALKDNVDYCRSSRDLGDAIDTIA